LTGSPFTSQWKQSFTYDRFGNRKFDTSSTATFPQSGFSSVQVINRNGRLEQLLQAGQTVHITVFNGLTNQRSSVKEFVR
jgi:hypothetical protein